MRRGWFIPLLLVAILAAACSSDSESSAQSVPATQAPAVQSTETVEAPDSSPTDVADPENGDQAENGDSTGPIRQELTDTFSELVLGDELVTTFMTRQEINCLAEEAFAVFTDERLGELGLDSESFTEAYRQPGLFVVGDWFDISDREAFDLENLALGCVDWRNFVVQVLVSEGEPIDQAECIASQISVDGLRAVVRDAMVVDTGEGFGEAQDEVASALTSCYLNASPVTVS
ncbi:hypothetical protein [Candidatus Poriferisocius sp.]|uniref:hypothetical protein n=1 Tax=Candidatus Poriferisocius sp. TaxID=3101276 RepID=UPI003B5188C3